MDTTTTDDTTTTTARRLRDALRAVCAQSVLLDAYVAADAAADAAAKAAKAAIGVDAMDAASAALAAARRERRRAIVAGVAEISGARAEAALAAEAAEHLDAPPAEAFYELGGGFSLSFADDRGTIARSIVIARAWLDRHAPPPPPPPPPPPAGTLAYDSASVAGARVVARNAVQRPPAQGDDYVAEYVVLLPAQPGRTIIAAELQFDCRLRPLAGEWLSGAWGRRVSVDAEGLEAEAGTRVTSDTRVGPPAATRADALECALAEGVAELARLEAAVTRRRAAADPG